MEVYFSTHRDPLSILKSLTKRRKWSLLKLNSIIQLHHSIVLLSAAKTLFASKTLSPTMTHSPTTHSSLVLRQEKEAEDTEKPMLMTGMQTNVTLYEERRLMTIQLQNQLIHVLSCNPDKVYYYGHWHSGLIDIHPI